MANVAVSVGASQVRHALRARVALLLSFAAAAALWISRGFFGPLALLLVMGGVALIARN
jgi:hypothetical protein